MQRAFPNRCSPNEVRVRAMCTRPADRDRDASLQCSECNVKGGRNSRQLDAARKYFFRLTCCEYPSVACLAENIATRSRGFPTALPGDKGAILLNSLLQY